MRSRVLVALIFACAGGAFAYLWGERSGTEAVLVEPPPVVRAGRPTTVQMTETFSGRLSVETGDRVIVNAPGWSGLVTSVEAKSGDTVSDGSEIATVDGVARRLAVTGSPFFRPLTRGDEGDDVEQLQELLVRWGYLEQLPDNPSRFHWRSTRAVRRFGQDAGVDPATGIFDPGWVLWAPVSDEIAIVTSLLRAGEIVPAPGMVVLESTSVIAGYSLESKTDGAPVDLEGEWEIKIGVESLRGIEMLSEDNVIGSDALEELLQAAESSEEIELAPGEVYGFTVSAESVWVREVLSIPVTSLRPSVDGSTLCVFVRDSENDTWNATLVSPVESPGPNVIINDAPELAEREVLFNPSAVLEDPFCP